MNADPNLTSDPAAPQSQETPPNGDQNPQNQQTPPAPPAETVSLSKAEYAQLMTQVAILQNKLEEQAQQSATAPEPPPYAGKDINQLTNAELLDVIQRHSSAQQEQLMTTIMQIAVKEEIRDLGDRYPEFKSNKELRNQVLNVAEKNTHLSLEQSYLLLKGMNPQLTQQTQTQQTPPPTPPPSHRSEVQTSQVTQAKPMSVKEAAEAAFQALKYT